MPNKEFLENYPLYKKMIFGPEVFSSRLKPQSFIYPSINMNCPSCNLIQTYNIDNYEEGIREEKSDIFRVKYKCSGCHENIIEFLIRFNLIEAKDEWYSQVQKIGQFPAWSIETDKELDNILGEYSDYYKKGLTCESQSYGIGAHAYYRRITENIIDELLCSIFDLIEEKENKEKYQEALEKVKKERFTEKKIEIVKNLLPKTLEVEGVNPLKTLHSALSEGLHKQTDEECIKKAEIIRRVLIYLVNQIIKTKNDKSDFKEGLKNLINL